MTQLPWKTAPSETDREAGMDLPDEARLAVEADLFGSYRALDCAVNVDLHPFDLGVRFSRLADGQGSGTG